MFDRKRTRTWHRTRSAMVGLMAMLLVILPLATSFAGEAGGSYSGDDAYDPAAGGRPEMSIAGVAGRSDSTPATSYSGDDAYDPAAGGRPEMPIVVPSRRSTSAGASTYSGDDAYDPAAGGTPGEAVKALSANGPSPLTCALAEDEIASRNASRIPGGFSGDDAYDPAAGGTPELSLLTFAQDPDLIAACMPEAFGN